MLQRGSGGPAGCGCAWPIVHVEPTPRCLPSVPREHHGLLVQCGGGWARSMAPSRKVLVDSARRGPGSSRRAPCSTHHRCCQRWPRPQQGWPRGQAAFGMGPPGLYGRRRGTQQFGQEEGEWAETDTACASGENRGLPAGGADCACCPGVFDYRACRAPECSMLYPQEFDDRCRWRPCLHTGRPRWPLRA